MGSLPSPWALNLFAVRLAARLIQFLQICLAAAASFVALCSLAGGILGALLPRRVATAFVQSVAALFLMGTGLLALSRSVALVVNYGAPLRIYQHLPEVGNLWQLWLLPAAAMLPVQVRIGR